MRKALKEAKKKEKRKITKVSKMYSLRKNGIVAEKKKKSWQVPFDSNGNLLWHPTPSYTLDNFHRIVLNMSSVIWKDPYEFSATISIQEVVRGRSAVYFIGKDMDSGQTFPIFLSDMVSIMENSEILHGTIREAKWTFAKKGDYYGIKILASGSQIDHTEEV